MHHSCPYTYYVSFGVKFSLSEQMVAEVPAAVNSISFNHNGNLIVAGCSDGVLRLFGMHADLSPALNLLNVHFRPCYHA